MLSNGHSTFAKNNRGSRIEDRVHGDMVPPLKNCHTVCIAILGALAFFLRTTTYGVNGWLSKGSSTSRRANQLPQELNPENRRTCSVQHVGTDDGASNELPTTSKRFNDSSITSENQVSPSSRSLLESCLIPVDSCQVRRMSSTDLAYIGDVVYELFVRSKFVWPSRRTTDLQNRVVAVVRAEFQAHLLAKIRSSETTFILTTYENGILSRGRNAVSGSKHRKSNPVAYQDATALEALIGYLYIDDRSRCAHLLHSIAPFLEEK